MGYSKNSTFLDGHMNAGQSFITFFLWGIRQRFCSESQATHTTKISEHILKCQSHDTWTYKMPFFYLFKLTFLTYQKSSELKWVFILCSSLPVSSMAFSILKPSLLLQPPHPYCSSCLLSFHTHNISHLLPCYLTFWCFEKTSWPKKAWCLIISKERSQQWGSRTRWNIEQEVREAPNPQLPPLMHFIPPVPMMNFSCLPLPLKSSITSPNSVIKWRAKGLNSWAQGAQPCPLGQIFSFPPVVLRTCFLTHTNTHINFQRLNVVSKP